MATVVSEQRVLSDELLQTFGERAPAYDRENRFFSEDFEDLRLAGYLELAVPDEFGGGGRSLAEVCQEQRRLAYRAPATALATNMHLYWTGVVGPGYAARRPRRPLTAFLRAALRVLPGATA
jgi:alkylation response protein AidB-like acyl-CoA dehydrogenase